MNFYFLKEVSKFFALFIIYLILFITSRIIFKFDIIFYEGIIIIIVLTLVSILFKIFSKKETYLTFILFCYAFHITIPSLLDRSISLYIIGILHEEKMLAIHDLQIYFTNGFIYHNKSIEKRINEQVRSGNITNLNGKYSLTTKGNELFKINQIFAKIFNTNQNYVYPINYKDDNLSQYAN